MFFFFVLFCKLHKAEVWYFCFYRYHKRVSNIIDDVLEWSPRLALSGMMDKQMANETDSDNNMTDDGVEAMPHPNSTEEETISEQFEADETG